MDANFGKVVLALAFLDLVLALVVVRQKVRIDRRFRLGSHRLIHR